jgi:hypothetical protein
VLIDRDRDATRLRSALRRSPVVLLTGPRQAGKSTLARTVVAPPRASFFDLEDPRDAARLAEPTLALSGHPGTVVIDEAQHVPNLFPVLRVLVDENPRPGRFLILGSASPDLVGLTSESLAGRVTLVELTGLSVRDVGATQLADLWLRGGLPPSYTAPDLERSNLWRDDYIRTFLERDLALLGFRTPAATMRRFWTMLAHYHGQTWNGSELGEGWFWATHGGAELDLYAVVSGTRVGFEVKRTDRPRITPSMRRAMDDLELDHLVVIHAGTERFMLAQTIEAVPAIQALTEGWH